MGNRIPKMSPGYTQIQLVNAEVERCVVMRVVGIERKLNSDELLSPGCLPILVSPYSLLRKHLVFYCSVELFVQVNVVIALYLKWVYWATVATVKVLVIPFRIPSITARACCVGVLRVLSENLRATSGNGLKTSS